MAVRVAKIDAAAAVPIVELTVVEVPRCAAVRQLRLANAAQDGIELGVADLEGVVVALELLVVVEKQRERVVDTHRREMAARLLFAARALAGPASVQQRPRTDVSEVHRTARREARHDLERTVRAQPDRRHRRVLRAGLAV